MTAHEEVKGSEQQAVQQELKPQQPQQSGTLVASPSSS
jgi:hypothetical protein